MNFQHNHPPMSNLRAKYASRVQSLTEAHKHFIRACAKCLLPTRHIMELLQAYFGDAPTLLEREDVRNVVCGNRAEDRPPHDADRLLQLIFDMQREDPSYFMRYEKDDCGRLTHLFWQSPKQRALATDVYQVIFHDNTYKTNRFKLPFGVFCGVNRHGHTVLLGQCLTFKEGTSDYEWAYNSYQESVKIDPDCFFTDADPAATAAAAIVWPNTVHGWCTWHMYQNITKNLANKLGDNFKQFLQGMKAAEKQLSKDQFWCLYNALKDKYPAAVPYMDEHLTPNVEHWAAFSMDTFTAGSSSTQRGESLNRKLKDKLDSRSSLNKLFEAVKLREIWEDNRGLRAECRDDMNFAEVTPSLPPNLPVSGSLTKPSVAPKWMVPLATVTNLQCTMHRWGVPQTCSSPRSTGLPRNGLPHSAWGSCSPRSRHL